jgi:hypothetical protein
VLRRCLPRFASCSRATACAPRCFVVGGDLEEDPEGRALLADLAAMVTSSPATRTPPLRLRPAGRARIAEEIDRAPRRDRRLHRCAAGRVSRARYEVSAAVLDA